MKDIVFTVLGAWKSELQNGTRRVNNFLEENEDYEIKSVTPISALNGGDTFTGMVFVLSEKKIKRIKENK